MVKGSFLLFFFPLLRNIEPGLTQYFVVNIIQQPAITSWLVGWCGWVSRGWQADSSLPELFFCYVFSCVFLFSVIYAIAPQSQV
jgi:hypothetical protein